MGGRKRSWQSSLVMLNSVLKAEVAGHASVQHLTFNRGAAMAAFCDIVARFIPVADCIPGARATKSMLIPMNACLIVMVIKLLKVAISGELTVNNRRACETRRHGRWLKARR